MEKNRSNQLLRRIDQVPLRCRMRSHAQPEQMNCAQYVQTNTHFVLFAGYHSYDL